MKNEVNFVALHNEILNNIDKEKDMKNLLKIVFEWIELTKRAHAAATLARMNRYSESRKLMEK
ncbi:MAG: hypothetical protein N2235_11615 [Fischerella sp.]|nr:hypothetical protein [Fischerella sp.]